MTPSAWAHNVRKVFLGRQRWRVDDEYSYYDVTPEKLELHARRQVQFEREVFVQGLQTARAMGILDRGMLAKTRVLDIGAGECMLAQALAFVADAAEVIAIDAVPKQIWAPASHHRNAPRIRFVVADAMDLPFEAGSFDLVVGNLVLHHINPVGQVFHEINRVLRPGGVFVALEPMPLAGILSHEVSSRNEAPVAPRIFAREASNAGLIDIKVSYWWERLRTSALGPLSPGYRITASRAGNAAEAAIRLRRPLSNMSLPGLLIDSECKFRPEAEKQANQITALWSRVRTVPGFRGI